MYHKIVMLSEKSYRYSSLGLCFLYYNEIVLEHRKFVCQWKIRRPEPSIKPFVLTHRNVCRSTISTEQL